MNKIKLHKQYQNKNGDIVPSVTTILQILGLNKQILIRWAVNQVKQGNDPFKVVEKAADVGTVTHYLIECYLKGEKPDLKDFAQSDINRAKNAFNEFLEWAKYRKIKLIGSELVVISEKFQYGGTLDFVVEVESNIELIDFKTSNGVYPDHKIQIIAYGVAWNENNPDRRIKNYHLLQLEKDNANFHHHKYSPESLKPCWKVFKNLREIYDLRKLI